MFDCEKDIEDNKQPHLSMNLKRAPMYSKMVEDMLQMIKIQHDATLECKWEAFKKVTLSCTNTCFSTNHTSWKYRAIMIDSLMDKLFGCIMESKISAWDEKIW